MTKVHVSFEFDNMQEASKFFGEFGHPTQAAAPAANFPTPGSSHTSPIPQAQQAPAPVASASPATTPIPTSAPVAPAAIVTPVTVTAGPTADNVDFGLAARTALSELVARFDATAPGSGAQKAKEILTKHGLTRVRDVTAAQAPALIADFKSAA